MFERQPAVAGMFYPAEPDKLKASIEQYLQEANPVSTESGNNIPKALIVPHAGYIYSGPIAASAFAQLKNLKNIIKRVVLLGPSHRVPVLGLAASSADHFLTPLGAIDIDKSAVEQVIQLPQVHIMDEAHSLEHSLEVQLPFLQECLGSFKLVPLVVGDANSDTVANVLNLLWGGPETLIVISSDLSHYHSYEQARLMDEKTAHAIESFADEEIDYDDACGRNPVKGLLKAAAEHHLHIARLDLRNSGDTAGSKDQVVGYGAWILN